MGLKPGHSEAYAAACDVERPRVPRGFAAESTAFLSLFMQGNVP